MIGFTLLGDCSLTARATWQGAGGSLQPPRLCPCGSPHLDAILPSLSLLIQTLLPK